ncbi:hypothetical protein ACQ4PT_013066 [Festuca glaucescens]
MLGSSWTTPVDSSDWIGMEKEVTTPRPEAMVLLNCAVENPYDRDKCLSLLDALRECIAQKYAWMEAYQVTMCTEDLDQGQTIGVSTWRVEVGVMMLKAACSARAVGVGHQTTWRSNSSLRA